MRDYLLRAAEDLLEQVALTPGRRGLPLTDRIAREREMKFLAVARAAQAADESVVAAAIVRAACYAVVTARGA